MRTPEEARKALIKKFVEYHRDNPHVYELFKAGVQGALEEGRKRISARNIMEGIRYEIGQTKDKSYNPTTKKPYRVNHNYCPYYARLYVIDHPTMAHYFEIREPASK